MKTLAQQKRLEALGLPVTVRAELAKLTSLGAGGQAALLAEPQDREQLLALFEVIEAERIPWFLIGRGTNLVPRNQDYDGLLIKLGGAFKEILTEGTQLSAGAAASDAKVARAAQKAGLSGLEWLVTVPGSLGGAVRMNAGAHGGEVADSLKSAELFHVKQGIYNLPAEGLELGYRSSRLQQSGELVLNATFQLSTDEPEAIAAKERALIERRKKSQPVGIKTFGSIFKNPAGKAAWALIEEAGLRGTTVGGFRLSAKHCNFLENFGGPQAEGLIELIELVQHRVYQQTGVRLELEGNLFPPEI